MADLNEILADINRAAASESPESVIAQRVGIFGSSGLLTQRYTTTSNIAEYFYDGPEFGASIEAGTVPLIYGKKMLVAGQTVDGGDIRSNVDPSRIQKVFKIRLGEGPVGGIIGDTPEDQLKNTFINCNPVVNDDGTPNISDIALASVAGAAIPYIFNEIAEAIIGDKDPVTGLPINSVLKDPNPTGMKLVDLKDVVSSGNCKDMVLISDGECKWVAKHFNQALLDSGMTADGGAALENVGGGKRVYKVTENGVAKLRTLVAGTGVTITENADTIVISAEPNAPSPYPEQCSVGVCTDPGKVFGNQGDTYQYRWIDGVGRTAGYTGTYTNMSFETTQYKTVPSPRGNALMADRKVLGDRCSGYTYGDCPALPITIEQMNPISGKYEQISGDCDPCSPPAATPKSRTVVSTDGGVNVPFAAPATAVNTQYAYNEVHNVGNTMYARDRKSVV